MRWINHSHQQSMWSWCWSVHVQNYTTSMKHGDLHSFCKLLHIKRDRPVPWIFWMTIPSRWESSLEPHQAFHSICPPELRIYADFVSPKKTLPHKCVEFMFNLWHLIAEVQIPLLHFFSPQVNTESWIWNILTSHAKYTFLLLGKVLGRWKHTSRV